MLISSFFFLLYSFLFTVSCIMVIGSNNPIHSVLFLVLCFFNATGLLILLEAEFMAMMFLIIYVGAIAILFLFVVMMLNVKIVVANFNLLRYLPVAGLISIILFVQLASLFSDLDGLALFSWSEYVSGNIFLMEVKWINWFSLRDFVVQPAVLGSILYTYSYDVFILAGIILLIAMISAILLTLQTKTYRHQYIGSQIEHVSRMDLFK